MTKKGALLCISLILHAAVASPETTSFCTSINSANMSTFTESCAANPFFDEWTANYGLPPFDKIKTEHFKPALELGMKQNLEEAKMIAELDCPPTFENTIVALDRSGGLLDKVQGVFTNICESCCPPELQDVQTEMAVPLASHGNAIYTYPGLFQRIDEIFESRLSNTSYSGEQLRLIERIHLDFVRAGARFDVQTQERYAAITEKLAELTTKFGQNVMADETSFTLEISDAELGGLPDEIVDATRQNALEKGMKEGYIITLSRSLVEPLLTYSTNRELREKVWRAFTSRGELDPARDNNAIAEEIVQLRAEQARLHGYASYADFATADTMAGNPNAVMELLERVWTPAKAAADRERQALEAFIRRTEPQAADGEGIQIDPWDWRFYAEKVRQAEYDFDESVLKPYMSLDHMTNAIFDVANQLFGLVFVYREDIPGYHPDVKVYEVFEEGVGENGTNRFVGLFLHDNYARPFKQSGAWMSEFRTQNRNSDASGEFVYPIIVNNNNFNKGEPTLLSFDDAETLFHEFGHGMHGMLSDCRYKRLAGTNVLRDFVELPSQLMEHWLKEPKVLKKHARHYETDEPLPDELFARLMAAQAFNQGFDTIEYLSCALVDQALHKVPEAALKDVKMDAFEKAELARLGMPKGIAMRHRLPHFQHMFGSDYYAAGYYVYLWAEVLDADGFAAFKETGDCFDKETALKVRQFIYSAGNTREPGAAYRAFRGRDPVVEPMLRKKGMKAV